MSKYHLNFDGASFEQLDKFALLCDQDYNYGDHGQWFNNFRGGLYGAYNRIHGISESYQKLHSWLPMPSYLHAVETHLANLFFNMDSCLECLVFALNALGYCAKPEQFHDVTDAAKLKRIRPENILGSGTGTPSRPPLIGYTNYFPSVIKHWQGHEGLLHVIFEQHDVSKHRKTIFVGGRVRSDMPPGYFKKLGLEKGDVRRSILRPMAEISLMPEPKVPVSNMKSLAREDMYVLEEIAPQFQVFVDATGVLALADAQANIPLTEKEFRKESAVTT